MEAIGFGFQLQRAYQAVKTVGTINGDNKMYNIQSESNWKRF